MLEVIVPIVVIIIFLVILMLYLYSREKEKPYTQDNIINDSYSEKVPSDENVESFYSKTKFDEICSLIKNRFQPNEAGSEKDYEDQLIQFLNKIVPNIAIQQGHTRKGIKIDFVVEGTIAIELILVNNEGKLVNAMTQMSQSKEDFDRLLIVLVKTGLVSISTIDDYVKQFDEMGIVVILKSVGLKE